MVLTVGVVITQLERRTGGAPPERPGSDTPDPELLTWRQMMRSSSWPGYENDLYRQWNSAYLDMMRCEPNSPLRDLPVGVPRVHDGATKVAKNQRYSHDRHRHL